MRYSRLRQRIYDVTTVRSNSGDEEKPEIDQKNEQIGDKKDQTVDESSTQGIMEDNDCNHKADEDHETGQDGRTE